MLWGKSTKILRKLQHWPDIGENGLWNEKLKTLWHDCTSKIAYTYTACTYTWGTELILGTDHPFFQQVLCYIWRRNLLLQLSFLFNYRMRPPEVPKVNYFGQVVGNAFAIAMVGYVICISLGKIFALRHGYTVDSNQVKSPSLCSFHFIEKRGKATDQWWKHSKEELKAISVLMNCPFTDADGIWHLLCFGVCLVIRHSEVRQ